MILNLHSANVWRSVERSRHDARNGITVEIPTQNELCQSSFIYAIAFYQLPFGQQGYTYSVLRLDRPVNILLCTSRNLFSDKNLREREKKCSSLCKIRCIKKWKEIASSFTLRYNFALYESINIALRVDRRYEQEWKDAGRRRRYCGHVWINLYAFAFLKIQGVTRWLQSDARDAQRNVAINYNYDILCRTLNQIDCTSYDIKMQA